MEVLRLGILILTNLVVPARMLDMALAQDFTKLNDSVMRLLLAAFF